MRWSRNEIDRLFPILEQISADLAPIDGKEILVLCSGAGEVAFWLAEMMESGKVSGLELDGEALEISRHSAHEMGLEPIVAFAPVEMDHIPVPDTSFDALVSEFIVYPTSSPTQIGQPEMGRVLKPGGRMILTDVIVTKPLPKEARAALQAIGLDYLCEATTDDFRGWMTEADLVNIQVVDMTSTVRKAWESRRSMDKSPTHWMGYSYLLEDPQLGLGKAISYIYVRGDKRL